MALSLPDAMPYDKTKKFYQNVHNDLQTTHQSIMNISVIRKLSSLDPDQAQGFVLFGHYLVPNSLQRLSEYETNHHYSKTVNNFELAMKPQHTHMFDISRIFCENLLLFILSF